ncbi:ABC transporter substrate-binding protein [Streptomyces colonosanans]|uniref:ABC transporter substrate-binding protein n=1 Tax=Streptomyces colonosanans TaxID=1428652 RepID=UPI000A40BEB7|nr:ABC transporter substrate-binding protein [Streptomyces colonosanans]
MDTPTSPLLAQPPPLGRDLAVTDTEVAALVGLATARGARSIAVGSGRTPAALAAADAITQAWQAAGGVVAATTTWPETAASWLCQARRFADAPADVWVMTGPEVGWAQVARWLLWSTSWRPDRTLATAAIGRPAALALVGAQQLRGLTGAGANGATLDRHRRRRHRGHRSRSTTMTALFDLPEASRDPVSPAPGRTCCLAGSPRPSRRGSSASSASGPPARSRSVPPACTGTG